MSSFDNSHYDKMTDYCFHLYSLKVLHPTRKRSGVLIGR